MRLGSILSAAALLVAGTSAFAQSTTLPSQNVGARVVVPIVITKDNTATPQVDGQDLYFGRFLSPAAAGTITLTPANAASFTGGVSTTLNNTTPRYNITASNNMVLSVAIAFPANVSNGAQTMVVSSPRFSVQGAAGVGTASGGTFTYNTSTANYFLIGGTLAVAASQADGLYTNTYSVTVAYN